MAGTLSYRPDIDGLRAIAVAAVVAFHAFPERVSGGFTGVDIFFVISGYLITGIIVAELEKGKFSLAHFYARRVRRILPALLLVSAATFAIGWHLLLPDELAQLGRMLLSMAAFSSNFMLWSETGYFDPAASENPMLHLWSLAVEEQFYLIWPIAVLALSRLRHFWWVVLAGATCSFVVCGLLTASHPSTAFYFPVSRGWELLAGALLVAVRERKFSARLADLISSVGIILILWSIFWLTEADHFPGWAAAMPVLGATLFIQAGPHAWPNRVLSSRALVSLGLVSYPLYLWHWPLLVYARQANGGQLTHWGAAVVIAASLALAFLTFRLVELPVRGLPWRRAVPAAAVAALAAFGVAGGITNVAGGFEGRYDEQARQVAAFRYDYVKAFRGGTCFLNPDQTYEDFADCGLSDRTGKPRTLLWGDSYVAHLYAGYSAVFAPRMDIVQRTASACPPFVGQDFPDRRFCRSINDGILELLAREKFDRVVLSTTWDSVDPSGIEATLNAIKAIGVRQIDLVGPVPRWTDRMPELMLREYVRTGTLPSAMSIGLSPSMRDIDPIVEEIAARNGVNYLSPAKLICSDGRCPTMAFPGDPSTIVSYDTGHLTQAGSIELVSTFVEGRLASAARP